MDDQLLDALHKINDQLQDYVNAHEGELPRTIVQLLTDLDWLLNGP
jgi:hypothetical protein